MSDNVFLDSNILVYSYSNSEIQKQEIARQLIADSNSFISTQVLQELCNIVTRKFKFTYEQAAIAIKESCQNNSLHVNTEDTLVNERTIYTTYATDRLLANQVPLNIPRSVNIPRIQLDVAKNPGMDWQNLLLR